MTKSINTYGYLISASENGLVAAEILEEGSFYSYMSSLVFSAFTMEAYINHVGDYLFVFWDDVEKLRPLGKLNLVCSLIAHDIDMGKRPYQSLTKLFKFRNELAHGKTKFPSADKNSKQPWWRDYCTKTNAENVRTDIAKIIQEINTASEINDPWVFNHESY